MRTFSVLLFGASLATLMAPWLAARGACPDFNPGPLSAPFAQVTAQGDLLLEIRVEGAIEPATLEPVLTTLESRKISATILLAPAWAVQHPDAARRMAAAGHEVGVLLHQRDLPDPGVIPRAAPGMRVQAGAQPMGPGIVVLREWLPPINEAIDSVRAASGEGIKAAGIDVLSGGAEQVLEAVGVRAILPLDPGEPGPARPSRTVDGMPARSRVLPALGWTDSCGPELPAWTPAAFDRVAAAVGASPALRVAIPPVGANPSLLAAWLDEVATPARWRTLTASKAAAQVRAITAVGASLGLGSQEPQPLAAAPGRYVETVQVRAAAERIASGGRFPRSFPGDLNVTEAFVGLALLLARPDAEGMRLPPLEPPPDLSRGSLSVGTPLDPESVRAAAIALVPTLRGAVPGIVQVGDAELSAGEFMVAMAKVALGQQPSVQRAEPPDPYAPGLGWGKSG
jgi:hypothetical protein